eukprot:2601415-Pyramimonas_sp.AAC.1
MWTMRGLRRIVRVFSDSTRGPRRTVRASQRTVRGVNADDPTLRGLCSPDVRHTRATVRCDTIITPRAVTDLLA